MVTQTHLIFFDTECKQPVTAEASPVLEPLQICTRLTEEFKLHLLKLSCTECEVTRCDLITERFTDLTDTERDLLTGSSLYVLEIYENTLCCFRTQINSVLCIFRNALECFEHQVELTDICEIVLATGRAGDIVILHKRLHFFLRECIDRLLQGDAFFLCKVFDQLVSTESFMTFLTVHQRICKAAKMSTGYPCLWIH